MFSRYPIKNRDSIWVKCYSTYASRTRKLCKTVLSGIFFTKTSTNSTQLDEMFIKNKHFKINLHKYLTNGELYLTRGNYI